MPLGELRCDAVAVPDPLRDARCEPLPVRVAELERETDGPGVRVDDGEAPVLSDCVGVTLGERERVGDCEGDPDALRLPLLLDDDDGDGVTLVVGVVVGSAPGEIVAVPEPEPDGVPVGLGRCDRLSDALGELDGVVVALRVPLGDRDGVGAPEAVTDAVLVAVPLGVARVAVPVCDAVRAALGVPEELRVVLLLCVMVAVEERLGMMEGRTDAVPLLLRVAVPLWVALPLGVSAALAL